MTWLYFRNPRLCTAILGYLAETDDQLIAWDELVVYFTTDERTWKTVENRLYDLIAFGAIHRTGGRRTAQKRAVKLTPLGKLWLDQQPPAALPTRLRADLTTVEDDDDEDDFS